MNPSTNKFLRSIPAWVFALAPFVMLLVLFLSIRVNHLFSDPTSTVLLDRNGQLLGAKIAGDGQWRFPALQNVPEKFEKALIITEDKRFYYHPGVDPIAIARAIVSNTRAGARISGASTISMQVIRLSRKDKPRTLKEKVVESVMAVRLELKYSKKEILALYASHAPFGGNVVGLDAAAWRYFGRDSGELSWAEAATLAVLPNSPALIHPGRNRQALLNRRNRLLKTLMMKGRLTREDYELALLEPLPERPLSLPMYATHLLERLHSGLSGKMITSTLDMRLQANATRIVNNYSVTYRHNLVNNAAAIIIDNRNRQVLAYVGNVSDAGNKMQGVMVDVITSPRSGGSILKPFLFSGMLHEGLINANTLIPDYPFQTPGFNPQNFDRRFDGAVPASRALQRSLNVPAVRMLQQYGVEKFYFLLQQLGMRTLNKPPSHYGLSLVLGGAESTLWDVTAMYARLSRILQNYSLYDGMYLETDIFNPLIILPTAETETNLTQLRKNLQPTQVLDASAIWVTFNALLEVNRPEEESGWKMFSNVRRIAWKTGTSYGNRDAWAVGTTPEYTIGVWVGNASGEGRPELTGVGFAAPILFDLFGLMPATGTFFKPYDDMTMASICRNSGHIAGAHCTETDSMWIPLKGQRTINCPYHVPIHLDNDGKFRVNSDCFEVYKMKTESWFILPPAMEWFYQTRNPDYKPLPPWHPACAGQAGHIPLQLIYPAGHVQVMIPREMDGSQGKIVLQAVHSNNNAVVFWHLDNEYLGATHNVHNMAVSLPAGLHHLVLVDENGFRIGQSFTVLSGKSKLPD